MKYTLIALSVLFSSSLLAENKNLTFYKDLTHYKESKKVNLNEKVFITLTDTAVLDTFNVALKHNNELLEPKSIEIHPKNEENIFKLNKNQIVFINGKKYTLVENGKGFIKVRNENNLVTFIPKHKIDEISFTNDVNSTTHIAQVISYEDYTDVDMSFSYALGEMSWKPKYNIYLKGDGVLNLDYNIEINNETLNSFDDVKVVFMLEDISRYYNDFTSSKNGGIFDFEQYVTHSHYYYREEKIERLYDEEGYDQFGYDKSGFDKAGFNMAARNIVSTKLFEGKRGFSFSNLVDVPAKSKTLYPYKSAIEMKYEKENSLHLSHVAETGDVYVPTSSISIKNESGITISEGVMRIFSGDKGYDSTVIKEHMLYSNNGDEDIEVSLGDNYSIKLKVLEKSSNSFKYFVEKSLIKELKSERGISSVELTINSLDVEVDNPNKEDLTLKHSFFIPSENLDKVKSLLKDIHNDSGDYKDYEMLKDKIKLLTVEEIDFNNDNKLNFLSFDIQYN